MFRSSPGRQDLRNLADEDRMELVQNGYARAFEVVFDRHAGAAFSLAYRMCGQRAQAEDVVQEAFLSLWRSGARYDRVRGSVRSWILSTVHNRAVDAIRRDVVKAGRDMGEERLAEQVPSGERTELAAERRDSAYRIHRALHELPSDQRRVVELAYFGGFTHTQIAEILKLPSGTVKGRMRLALSKLRVTLESDGLLP